MLHLASVAQESFRIQSAKPIKASKVVTVANGDECNPKDNLSSLHVLLDSLEAKIDFVFLKNVPYDMIIKGQALELLEDTGESRGEEFCIERHVQFVILSIFLEYSQTRKMDSCTGSEELTSVSDFEASELYKGSSKIANEKEIFLAILEDEGKYGNSPADSRETSVYDKLKEKISHMHSTHAASIRDFFLI